MSMCANAVRRVIGASKMSQFRKTRRMQPDTVHAAHACSASLRCRPRVPRYAPHPSRLGPEQLRVRLTASVPEQEVVLS